MVALTLLTSEYSWFTIIKMAANTNAKIGLIIFFTFDNIYDEVVRGCEVGSGCRYYCMLCVVLPLGVHDMKILLVGIRRHTRIDDEAQQDSSSLGT